MAILKSQNSLYSRSCITAGATKISAHMVAAVLMFIQCACSNETRGFYPDSEVTR